MKDKIINIGTTVVVKKKILVYKNGCEYELKFQRKGTVTGISCDSYIVQFIDGTYDHANEEDIVEVLDTPIPTYTMTIPIEWYFNKRRFNYR